MSKLLNVGMAECQGVAIFFTHYSICERCDECENGIQLVEVISSQHASNFMVSTEPVQVIRDVSFRKIDVYGFGSGIAADGRQEDATSSQ